MKRINLIPQEAGRIRPQKWLKNYFLKSRALRSAVFVFIFLVVVNVWQATTIVRYKIAIASGRNNIVRLKTKVRDAQRIVPQIKNEKEAVEKEIRRIEKRLEILQEAHKEKYTWARALEYVSELVPDELWINKMQLNKELVTIDGTTFDNMTVSNFMKRLDGSGYFRDTSFNYTEKSELTEKSVIDFEVTTHTALEKIKR